MGSRRDVTSREGPKVKPGVKERERERERENTENRMRDDRMFEGWEGKNQSPSLSVYIKTSLQMPSLSRVQPRRKGYRGQHKILTGRSRRRQGPKQQKVQQEQLVLEKKREKIEKAEREKAEKAGAKTGN